MQGNVDAALDWTDRFGDSDGDGYLDYRGAHGQGLVNQGWKDSGIAITNADGSLAIPPIALCEVQGYLYRAWLAAARLLTLSGNGGRARSLTERAAALRERFERDFWSERLGCYVLALQRGGRPVEVVAYNPLSYQLGSVWPHDNALILAGFRRYGCDTEAQRVFAALRDAAGGLRGHRLPELYAGFERDPYERHPVRYPVACSPQAWAAAAMPYALVCLLGLEPDVDLTFLRSSDDNVGVSWVVREGPLVVEWAPGHAS